MAVSDRIQYDRARLVSEIRHELRSLGEAPVRAELERLRSRIRDLGTGDDVADESALLQGYVEADGMRARLERGDLPVLDPGGYLPPSDICHFVAPVRFGRRRLDHVGHLLLTAEAIRFRGAVDVSLAWGDVESVRRDDREIVVSLQQRRWTLRFWCHSYAEATVGVVIANHLRRTVTASATDLS